jgi:hypothetical protein
LDYLPVKRQLHRAEALLVDLGKESHFVGGFADRVSAKDTMVIRGGISMKAG